MSTVLTNDTDFKRHALVAHFHIPETVSIVLYIYIYMYYMAELPSRSVRKITHADWLPSRAIRFSYRPASFGGKMSKWI